MKFPKNPYDTDSTPPQFPSDYAAAPQSQTLPKS